MTVAARFKTKMPCCTPQDINKQHCAQRFRVIYCC